MKSFYVNPMTNDLEFDGSNNIKMVDGDEELIQSIWMIISTNVGEWFLNPEHGFDRAAVRGKKVDYNITTETLYAAILQEDRISSVDDIQFTFDPVKRELSIDFTCTKTDGQQIEGSATV